MRNALEIVEALRNTTEDGADPEVIYQAADEIERLLAFLTTIAYTGMTSEDAAEHAQLALRHNANVNGLAPEQETTK